MKSITLINPEKAQKVFLNYNWNDPKYYIKGIGPSNEEFLVNADTLKTNVLALSLKVGFGAEYDISLEEYGNEIGIELKDIDGLGAILLINNVPYLLHIFRQTEENSIQKIGDRFPELRIIDFGGNGKIKTLDCIAKCKQLHTLSLFWCENISDIGPLSSLTALTDLKLFSCSNLSDISPLSGLTALKNLNLSYCESISDIIPLSGLTALTDLDLSKCRNISKISPLSGLTALTNLNLSGCENHSNISPLSSLTALTNLNLSECENLSNISPLIGLTALTSLDLSRCDNLIDIRQLSNLTALTNLNLSECENLIDISPLSGLIELTNLNLSSGNNISKLSSMLTDLSALSGLTALTNLNLSRCKNISDLSSLSGLTALKNLNLSMCKNISDIGPLSSLTALTDLKLFTCSNLSDISPLSGLTALTNLDLSYCESISDIIPLSGLTALTDLSLSVCDRLSDIGPLTGLTALTNLNLSICENLSDISPLSGLSGLLDLNLSNCEKLTKVDKISKLTSLKKLNLSDSPNIRDFDRLVSLPNLLELSWIDPIACNEILMISAFHRKDEGFVKSKSTQWINELPLSKDAILFTSRLLNCISLLEANERNSVLQKVCKVMRARGLQSELLNDLDAYTWETWCNLVLELDAAQAMECLHAALKDLDIKRETEVLLGPVIVAASEFIQKHPTEKEKTFTWVNEQLLQLEIHPEEQRQIAPSAAVFFASLNKKEEVLFWLKKATNEKAPLWREKVLHALVNYYASQTDYTEARRLLDEMQIQEEKDKAIAALANFMAVTHPIDAGFLLDDIQEETISTEAARNMLQQPAMLREPQGIYQLLLHLQSNPDELSSTLETMISKDTDGQLAAAVKQLFLQAQTAGPSATVLLELCKHPSILDFVVKRDFEIYKAQLQERATLELATMVPILISEMQQENVINEKHAIELTQLMQHK